MASHDTDVAGHADRRRPVETHRAFRDHAIAMALSAASPARLRAVANRRHLGRLVSRVQIRRSTAEVRRW